MKCPKCNNDNPDGALYCSVCYEVLAKRRAAPAGTAEPQPAASGLPAHTDPPSNHSRALSISILILLVTILAGICVANRESILSLWARRPSWSAAAAETPNELFLGRLSKTQAPYTVAINPTMNFNHKTRAEIYELRRNAVLQHPKLAPEDYHPLSGVFGPIEDGKPWWGLYGVYFYGKGIGSIEGDSEESRFLLNPFLLVAVRERYAYSIGRAPEPNATFYPIPQDLQWNPAESSAIVRYNVKDHFNYMIFNRYPEAERRSLWLIAYNARDFGLNYLYVDREFSSNVNSLSSGVAALPIVQYIHCGGSCGYPGNCNNMSPAQSDLMVEISGLPAKAVIKLWRENPQSTNSPADFTYVIEMH